MLFFSRGSESGLINGDVLNSTIREIYQKFPIDEAISVPHSNFTGSYSKTIGWKRDTNRFSIVISAHFHAKHDIFRRWKKLCPIFVRLRLILERTIKTDSCLAFGKFFQMKRQRIKNQRIIQFENKASCRVNSIHWALWKQMQGKTYI